MDILKDISPEYAEFSYNLIDCLERMIERVLHTVISGNAPEESADAVMYLLVESIEKIHDAMAQDYDNAIEKL